MLVDERRGAPPSTAWRVERAVRFVIAADQEHVIAHHAHGPTDGDGPDARFVGQVDPSAASSSDAFVRPP